MDTHKKTLSRSIALGCVLFTVILCLTLSFLNYYTLRKALRERYHSQITDLLRYVDRHIDDTDLRRCTETGVESDAYRELLRFMDGIMDDFSVHYLYAIKPVSLSETHNVMVILSAEDYHNRYEDTEGNLYLGWVSDDEYDIETVRKLYEIMAQDDIVFFIEKTEWGTDYTGALPLRDDSGACYGILCVDIDVTAMFDELTRNALNNSGVVVLLGLLYTVAFMLWSRRNITAPVQDLEKGVVDFAGRSHGQRSVDALKFEAPVIRTDNEVKSLARAITQMTEDMQDYVREVLSAEATSRDMKKLADAMSTLATVDPLTGSGNLTACMREEEAINRQIAEDPSGVDFALAMIDINCMKYINDGFGHEKGDAALRCLAETATRAFPHSQVFRIGGDEFIVILRKQDCRDAEQLQERFHAETSWPKNDEPWVKLSASIGVAHYTPGRDHSMDDVLKRADQAMYDMKQAMHAAWER
ncbi:MAG: GGDEF domain-containing protein [Oscillospiraceae bacterium]|nr:GGDEF domain-containing protein [Oscillospiraceae bacterium]